MPKVLAIVLVGTRFVPCMQRSSPVSSRPTCTAAPVSTEGTYDVANHESALKAYRQSLVNRDRNRQYRSRLRTRAEERPRRASTAGKTAEAKSSLGETVSLIDKMAGKGIIHRNAAGRYKSRLMAKLERVADARHRRAAPRRPRAQLDHQPLEQDPRLAPRRLHRQIGPEHRVHRGPDAVRRSHLRQLVPHPPADLPERHERRLAGVGTIRI